MDVWKEVGNRWGNEQRCLDSEKCLSGLLCDLRPPSRLAHVWVPLGMQTYYPSFKPVASTVFESAFPQGGERSFCMSHGGHRARERTHTSAWLPLETTPSQLLNAAALPPLGPSRVSPLKGGGGGGWGARGGDTITHYDSACIRRTTHGLLRWSRAGWLLGGPAAPTPGSLTALSAISEEPEDWEVSPHDFLRSLQRQS